MKFTRIMRVVFADLKEKDIDMSKITLTEIDKYMGQEKGKVDHIEYFNEKI